MGTLSLMQILKAKLALLRALLSEKKRKNSNNEGESDVIIWLFNFRLLRKDFAGICIKTPPISVAARTTEVTH
jgi:hypothetical protein